MTVLSDIADLAELLCDPHQHTEQVPYWDANRNKKFRRHVTVQDGLLKQLHEAVSRQAGNDDSRAGGSGSRPPLQLEALSKHAEIQVAVVRWCWELRVELRDTLESDVRGLVGAAGNAASEVQGDLRADMRRWRTWCEVMTGWETVFSPKDVPCPVVGCGTVGTLRVLLAAKRAFCRNPAVDEDDELVCGGTWEEANIGVLADYIRSLTAGHVPARSPVRSGRAGHGGWLAVTEGNPS